MRSTSETPPSLPGFNLIPVFSSESKVEREIYFNHSGNKALRQGAWKLVSSKVLGNKWELYNLSEDRGETQDLSAFQPERKSSMITRWKKLNSNYSQDAAR